jgi:hypothetical protein
MESEQLGTPDWECNDPFAFSSAMRMEPLYEFPALTISSDSSEYDDTDEDETYKPPARTEKSASALFTFSPVSTNNNDDVGDVGETTIARKTRLVVPRAKSPPVAQPASTNNNDDDVGDPAAAKKTRLVMPRAKPLPPPKLQAPKKKAPPARKPRRLTDEQKAANKRKRDEDKSMLIEMRNFLAESTKKQKTVHQEMEATNSQMNALRVALPPPPNNNNQDGDTQADLIAYLSTTVASQQALIGHMNMEIFNMGSKYRHDLLELDLRYREDLDRLRDTIEAQREHDAAIQLRVSEWRSQRARLLDEMDNLRAALTRAKEAPPPVQSVVAIEPASPNSPPPSSRASPVVRVKHESTARPTDMTESATHYTWLVVEEANNARCLELYGFTAPQLLELGTQVASLASQNRGRGMKSTFGEKQTMLVMLYHFRHYTTIRVIHEKFGVSTSGVGDMIVRMLKSVVPGLFQWSVPLAPSPAFVRASYFLAIQTPAHTVVAGTMYDETNAQHGVWIHCMHCTASGKVTSYYSSNTREPEAGWIALFTPMQEGGVEGTPAADYGRRMRGKFALASSRYRGTLQEIDNTIRGLLALTNLDLGYANAICERVSVDLKDG